MTNSTQPTEEAVAVVNRILTQGGIAMLRAIIVQAEVRGGTVSIETLRRVLARVEAEL